MLKIKKTSFALILSCFLFACSSNKTEDLQIRIGNISDYNFSNIKVNTSGTIVNFDDLNSGEKSEYNVFDLAYRYAFIQLDIDGQTYTLQPIDYVGETPLEKGYYTYEIDIDLSSQFNQIILTLKTD